jgi:hypothetical protein
MIHWWQIPAKILLIVLFIRTNMYQEGSLYYTKDRNLAQAHPLVGPDSNRKPLRNQ